MKKIKKILAILMSCLLLGVVCILPVSALAADAPDITANAAIVVNAATGEVYYAKNENASVQPAGVAVLNASLPSSPCS